MKQGVSRTATWRTDFASQQGGDRRQPGAGTLGSRIVGAERSRVSTSAKRKRVIPLVPITPPSRASAVSAKFTVALWPGRVDGSLPGIVRSRSTSPRGRECRKDYETDETYWAAKVRWSVLMGRAPTDRDLAVIL